MELLKFLRVRCPFVDSIKKLKEKLRLFPVIEATTPKGKKFWLIDPMAIIMADLSNPLSSSHMTDDKLANASTIGNHWDASKWQLEPPTSSVTVNETRFWLGDFIKATTDDGQIFCGQICGFTYRIIANDANHSSTLLVCIQKFNHDNSPGETVIIHPNNLNDLMEVNVSELKLAEEISSGKTRNMQKKTMW